MGGGGGVSGGGGGVSAGGEFAVIARTPQAGVWTAIADSGKVVGFIAGTADVSSCYRGALRRELPAILWRILPSLLTLSTWRRAWNTLTYPRREIQHREEGARPEPTGELLAIVVAAEARGTGAAARLVQSLEDGLRRWGYAGPYRVVTAADDPRSNGFYAKIGFRPARDFMHHANPMRLYHKDLPRG